MRKILIPILAISISFLIMIYKGSYSWLAVAFIVLGLLIFFTILANFLALNKSSSAEEISKRTIS